MDVGMERSAKGGRLIVRFGLIALCVTATFSVDARAQGPPGKIESAPEPPAVARECGEANVGTTPLPNSALALQKDGKIKILAIGASSTAVLGVERDGNPPLLEQILERSIKGLDVEIINRGFSGELAAAAGQRLKIEVALNHPDLVLWQVGTNDAFAQVSVELFERSVSNSVRWLKEHNIDVILVGLHYMKQLAKDERYQAIRASLQRVTAAEHVLRITRYEAMEVLARTMRETGRPEPRDFGLTESGYNCMAQYVARAIAVGLYAKPPKRPAPAR
jgi:lysophospholipase L1-like esterase